MKLVLASGSPRRTAILDRLGIAHTVDPADIDERVEPDERPRAHVERLARAKAWSVAERHPGAHVLAGDTVVVRDTTILGKPETPDEAVQMLLGLAGRTHEVVSGLALVGPGLVAGAGSTAVPGSARTRPDSALERPVHVRSDVARVTFRDFDRAEAEAYVATGEPMDKAGAYAIQGLGSALVEHFAGEYHTIVGLSLPALFDLLARAGHPWHFGRVVHTEPPITNSL